MSTLILEHSDNCGSDRLGEALRDHGHRLDVRRLHAGDPLPADLDGIDAIVTCGGPASPLDDAQPWLPGEMALLGAASTSGLPVVGLCLGCQLLARALGGTVEELDGGSEAGWREVALTPAGREDPLFAGIAWRSMQPHWHRFHVSAPPAGARVLARSERTPVQAWSLGLRTYGIQYHAEMHAARMDRWAADESDVLAGIGLTRAGLAAETETHYPACARLADRLFERIALILMPLDRRSAGVVHELRH